MISSQEFEISSNVRFCVTSGLGLAIVDVLSFGSDFSEIVIFSEGFDDAMDFD